MTKLIIFSKINFFNQAEMFQNIIANYAQKNEVLYVLFDKVTIKKYLINFIMKGSKLHLLPKDIKKQNIRFIRLIPLIPFQRFFLISKANYFIMWKIIYIYILLNYKKVYKNLWFLDPSLFDGLRFLSNIKLHTTLIFDTIDYYSLKQTINNNFRKSFLFIYRFTGFVFHYNKDNIDAYVQRWKINQAHKRILTTFNLIEKFINP